MRRRLERAANAITAIAAVLSAVVAIALVATLLCGGHIVTVLSGSMEPTYQAGSLLFVKPVDTALLCQGDVIAYTVADRVMVTHRISRVVPDENGGVPSFRTKGDANAAEDELPVRSENVVGTPVFAVPFAGYVVNFVQHPPGVYVAAAAMLMILLAAFLLPLLDREEEDR